MKRNNQARFLVFLKALWVLTASCALLDYNFKTVRDEALYRSGQLPPGRLEKVLDEDGVRTVINLRGNSPHERWYHEQRAICARVGVAHYDLDWSMNRLPPPESLAQLVSLFDTAERPILVHCQGGTHRTGVASAVFLLLEGQSVESARAQLGPFFKDAPIGRVLDLYEATALAEPPGAAIPMPFREWVHDRYPDLYSAVVP